MGSRNLAERSDFTVDSARRRSGPEPAPPHEHQTLAAEAPRSRIGVTPNDNVGMDAGEQLAAEILGAIRSGRDLWVSDQFIGGPDCLERACMVLIEKRDACADPDEATFLTSIIRGLEKGRR